MQRYVTFQNYSHIELADNEIDHFAGRGAGSDVQFDTGPVGQT